ncbi:hypothetical protein OC842_002652 [Tilletia horrida]|uniref:AMP-dependent synthetase/ligase domain-containing protein n=1 Tax=Tilletia horrida TaxID=155126 RepID=A0AAN6GFI0_9BASI|nr:hypothetical protein OC842_002652 [Tilletia horrida]
MTIYRSSGPQVEHFPTDLDFYSFFFEYWPPARPDIRGTGVPLLIDDETGLSRTYEDLHARTDALSLGLSRVLRLDAHSTLCLLAPNTVDYLPSLLAAHRLGATVTPANPNLSAREIEHQLRVCGAQAVLVALEEPARSAGVEAARLVGIPMERVVLMPMPARGLGQGRIEAKIDGHWTLDGLVEYGEQILRAEGQRALDQCRYRLPKHQPNSTRTALLSFSSGTSGLPKGVQISHLNPIANILQHTAHMRVPTTRLSGDESGVGRQGEDAHDHVHVPARDRVLGQLPFFHIYGLVVVLSTSLWLGLGVVCVPRFRGTEFLLQTTVRHRVTHWFLVPPIIVKLIKEDAVTRPYLKKGRLGHVKFTMSGAAPLKDELTRAFLDKFPSMRFAQGYGMTETCATVVMSPTDQEYTLGSAGCILANTEARVVRPDGSDAASGEPGELWVRGPQVTMGYLNNEKETQASYLPGGWFRTGDEVVIDDRGLVYVVDRLKEMIKVKGYQVAPAELEGLLLDSKDVFDVGVVGLPDEESGELPLAFVSLSAGALARLKQAAAAAETDRGRQQEQQAKQLIAEGLLELVRANKVRYKHLAGVVIVPEVPKSPAGKILRKELKKLLPSVVPLRGRAKESGEATSGAAASGRLAARSRL